MSVFFVTDVLLTLKANISAFVFFSPIVKLLLATFGVHIYINSAIYVLSCAHTSRKQRKPRRRVY